MTLKEKIMINEEDNNVCNFVPTCYNNKVEVMFNTDKQMVRCTYPIDTLAIKWNYIFSCIISFICYMNHIRSNRLKNLYKYSTLSISFLNQFDAIWNQFDFYAIWFSTQGSCAWSYLSFLSNIFPITLSITSCDNASIYFSSSTWSVFYFYTYNFSELEFLLVSDFCLMKTSFWLPLSRIFYVISFSF